MNDPVSSSGGYWPIGAYSLIGDCHTAALVAPNGSIDWYCPGRFDAPAVFCRLLDARRGGHLQLAPVAGFSSERQYQGSTNILETVFTCSDGRARLTDFMPIHRLEQGHGSREVRTYSRILRCAEGLSGSVDVRLTFKPTPNYAVGEAEVSVIEGGAAACWDRHCLTLACPGIALAPDGNGGLSGVMRLGAGERFWIALANASPDRAKASPVLDGPDEDLARTREYWQAWSLGCTYRGNYRTQVERSALTLKLLTHQPSGAIVAAPTTSLPEVVGGVRNWDYRFSWLRDSAGMKYALTSIGFRKESDDYFRWLLRARNSCPTPSLQIVYAVDGRSDLSESQLDHLEGYRGSKPVRIGNGACAQQQLDVYGEVLAAAYVFFRTGQRRPSEETWGLLRGLVDSAALRWQEPDNGIWEIRGAPQLYLHSRLMCWVALDRGLRLCNEFGLPASSRRWRSTREAIREAILKYGFNKQVGAFTQAFGSTALDASALLIPRVGFLPANDDRVRSTIARIRGELTQDGLIRRYLENDGFPGADSPFVLCNFWLVDALAMGGRLEEAEDFFGEILSYANDVGLLSEEIDPGARELLGNFPQGFSHMALIGSAVTLAKIAMHGPEEEAETEAERCELASASAEP